MTEEPKNTFIDDLSDIAGINDLGAGSPTTPSTKPAKVQETYPCESCHGTGKYRGVRVHQQEDKCFACKGKGFYVKSYADRMAGRAKRAASKAKQVERMQAEFEASNPGFIAKVRTDLLPWNAFAAELLGQFEAKGWLSSGQVDSLQRQLDKNDARQAERAAKKQAEATAIVNNPVDTSAIRELFDRAKAKGLKKPGLWYGDLKISEAPSHGANAGSLYVKQGGQYVGKITGAKFLASWGVKQLPILEALLEIAKDPAEVLRVKGRETGTCCCCGRELTDPESIAAGIGPICATNWGL